MDFLRRSIAQGTVRPGFVVVGSVVFENDLGLQATGEDLPVQHLVPEATVEGLGKRILPRASRLDENRLHSSCPEPRLHRLGNELGSVVRPQIFGRTSPQKQVFQCLDYRFRVEIASDLYGQAFSCELVENWQYLKSPPVLGLVVDKVVAPTLVDRFSPMSD
jgi:hypothetical protein